MVVGLWGCLTCCLGWLVVGGFNCGFLGCWPWLLWLLCFFVVYLIWWFVVPASLIACAVLWVACFGFVWFILV